MKIKEGFIKRQVGERVVVVPIGEAAKNFHGMILSLIHISEPTRRS